MADNTGFDKNQIIAQWNSQHPDELAREQKELQIYEAALKKLDLDILKAKADRETNKDMAQKKIKQGKTADAQSFSDASTAAQMEYTKLNKKLETTKAEKAAFVQAWESAKLAGQAEGPKDMLPGFMEKAGAGKGSNKPSTHMDASGNEVEEAVTEDVTDKKCPGCGATVVYDPETLAMVCPFCGYSRELPKPEDNTKEIEELDFATAKNRASVDWGSVKKSVVCKNCGAETVVDDVDTALCCPFCGSTSVMPVDNDENVMAPGGVVPFEITKEKAEQLFKKWMKGKLFAPNEAKKSCEAKNFNGMYLPYWTYDSQTTSPYSVKLGFNEGSGENRKTVYRTYKGIYERFIDDEVVYASKKTTNQDIKTVSDFDFSKLRNYDPQFVAGFTAERYSVGLDEGWENAKEQIRKKLKNEIGSMEKKKHHADSISKVDFATSYANVTFKYVLAPIWIANFKFKDKVYNIVVNGQTGKIAGKSPISPIKVAIAIIIAIIVLIVLFNLLGN